VNLLLRQTFVADYQIRLRKVPILYNHLNVKVNLLNKQLRTSQMAWSSKFRVLLTYHQNCSFRYTELLWN